MPSNWSMMVRTGAEAGMDAGADAGAEAGADVGDAANVKVSALTVVSPEYVPCVSSVNVPAEAEVGTDAGMVCGAAVVAATLVSSATAFVVATAFSAGAVVGSLVRGAATCPIARAIMQTPASTNNADLVVNRIVISRIRFFLFSMLISYESDLCCVICNTCLFHAARPFLKHQIVRPQNRLLATGYYFC